MSARPRSPWRGLLNILWHSPLGAVVFAIFFGTLFGATWRTYQRAYWIAIELALSPKEVAQVLRGLQCFGYVVQRGGWWRRA